MITYGAECKIKNKKHVVVLKNPKSDKKILVKTRKDNLQKQQANSKIGKRTN